MTVGARAGLWVMAARYQKSSAGGRPLDLGTISMVLELGQQAVYVGSKSRRDPGPERSQMASYEGYCVKCRKKQPFEGEKKDLPNGRTAAQGSCPVCGTKITRMLGKTA
jgi:hypothetical protein